MLPVTSVAEAPTTPAFVHSASARRAKTAKVASPPCPAEMLATARWRSSSTCALQLGRQRRLRQVQARQPQSEGERACLGLGARRRGGTPGRGRREPVMGPVKSREMPAERLAGSGQRHRGGIRLGPQHEGDLAGRQAVDLTQQQRGSLCRRQPAQRGLDGADQLGLLEAVYAADRLRRPVRATRPAPQSPQVVVAGVDGDPIEPGPLVQFARLAETLEGLQQHVL